MSSSEMARTPQPPYYAVIFTSLRTADDRGYAATSDRMVELASRQPGFLGVESVRDADGVGITVSYWESTAAIAAWKAQVDHQLAQQRGRRDWYQRYEVRVARVERAYSMREPQR
jgi:heme-degrading monooxygenase HmoA